MQKIKKVIAREGLILLCLVFLSCGFFYLDYLQKTWVSKPVESSEVGKPKDLFDRIPDIEIMDIAKIPINQRPLFFRFDFNKIGLFSLFFAYPLYLVVRFILWAIKTLKEK